ncbi:MAG: tetratricopeptide repeat protein [Deltaproteobacteria bacterium]|nr:tetratricopeptide repeat protein [Candidatus Zymogenaceae bacterium]
MIERHFLPIALIVLFLSGCAHRIDVQHYPFGSPIHHAENGIAFIDMGFSEDAMREFKTALSDNPQFSPALAGKGIYWAIEGVPDVSKGYVELAKLYAAKDNEKVLALIASMRVSLIIADDGWLDRVTDDFSKIMSVSPNNDRALFWMGVSLIRAGNLEEAKKDLKKVVELEGMYKREAERYLKEIK